MDKKIAIIGAGNIGGIAALTASLKHMGDVVLLDKMRDFAVGKALDIQTTASVEGFPGTVKGTDDYKDIAGADVIIVTAGVPRNPSMKTRDELLDVNAKVVSEVAKNIATYAKDAFVICVTNPLDAMVGLFQKVSNMPYSHVVGMGGVLDTSRYKLFLKDALQVSITNIDTFVLGSHGDFMVPLVDYTTISGVPLKAFIESGRISKDTVDQIITRTRKGGGEIIKLLQKGSAFNAPAISALSMAQAYLQDTHKILPCATNANGYYGITEDMYMGLPIVIGKDGVEEIMEFPLTQDETVMLQRSADNVRDLNNTLEKLGY